MESDVKKNSRTYNSLRNFIFGFGARIFQYILSFATRTIFIKLLATEYLGVNGLFSNILSILSLAELGIGGSFSALLYKPLHERDTEKLKSLMNAYRKAFILVASTVGVIGLGLLPFLNIIIKDVNIENIGLIYIMFLTGSVVSYLCTYRISLIIADQKAYIYTLYSQIVIFLQYVLQIAVLLLTRNFILYLSIQIAGSIGINVLMFHKAGKMYPFLKGKADKLDAETRKDLFKKINASVYHHVGYVVLTGTDNVVISTFIGVSWVGIYSNYLMLIGVITAFTKLFFNAIVSSVGNLTVSTDNDTAHMVFKRIQFMNFLIVGLFSICLYILLNPFINLWIGREYLLDDYIVFLIVAMFYLGYDGIKGCVSIFKDTTGLFYNDRYSPLAEAIINIVLSVILVQKIGIAGAFLGTIIATLATNIWVEPYVVYKHFFRMPLTHYFLKLFKYSFFTLATGFFVKKIVYHINYTTWLGFFTMAICSVLLTAMIFVILSYRTSEFKYFYKLAKGLLSKYIFRK